MCLNRFQQLAKVAHVASHYDEIVFNRGANQHVVACARPTAISNASRLVASLMSKTNEAGASRLINENRKPTRTTPQNDASNVTSPVTPTWYADTRRSKKFASS